MKQTNTILAQIMKKWKKKKKQKTNNSLSTQDNNVTIRLNH